MTSSLSRTKQSSSANRASASNSTALTEDTLEQGKAMFPCRPVPTLLRSKDNTELLNVLLLLPWVMGRTNSRSSYSAKSGTLLLTNQRIVFISATPNAYFTSASLPIGNVQDSKLSQPWFSSATFKAVVMPVPGGGMTQPARLAISFTSGSKSTRLTTEHSTARRMGLLERERGGGVVILRRKTDQLMTRALMSSATKHLVTNHIYRHP